MKLKPTKKYKHFNHHHEIRPDQTMVKWKRKRFIADNELIMLLAVLNNAGLKTLSHCSGHGNNPSWIRLSMKNIQGVEVRKYDNSLIITWK